uniref:Uncharacterized protein n=1 Tax=Magallana gigas TaxID=29159 RepID=A0A8W8NM95_MAGGI
MECKKTCSYLILPSQEEFDDDDDDDVPLSCLQFSSEEDKEDDIPLVDLQRKMRLLPDTGSMTAEEYLVVDEEDEEEETGQQLKDVDIMLLTPLSATEKEKGICSEALDILWKVMDMVRRRQASELQQKKMTDFLSGSDEIINFSSVNNY